MLALIACAPSLGVAACGRPQPAAGVIVTERLRGPFDVVERRALFGRSIDRFDSPQSLPAVCDVLVEGFYTDKDASGGWSSAASCAASGRSPVRSL